MFSERYKDSLVGVGFGFDLEGTMVNLEPLHQQAFDKAVEFFDRGLRFTPDDLVAFSGKGDRVISEYLAKKLKRIDPALSITGNRIRELKSGIYRQMLHDTPIKPRPGVLDYIEQVRLLTNNLAIASLTVYDDAMHIIRASGLSEVFEHILTERDVTHLKPDPEVYSLTALTLGILPARLLVHEDSPTGVQAAVLAGCPVIAFPVFSNLIFDPPPRKIYNDWKGLNPLELMKKHVIGNNPRRD